MARARTKSPAEIFDVCFRRLAYHKAPGWIYFLDELPTTGNAQDFEDMIFPAGADPRTIAGNVGL